MSEPRRLLTATAVMASGTMVSRVLGFVRAIMMAAALGAGTQRVEVFNFAQSVPNSLYLLLAGGTLNSVLVPQIVRAVGRDADGGKAFVDRIMTGFMLIVGVVTIALTAASPWVMSVYTNPQWRTPAMASQWQSLVVMSYITMPQIFFYGMFFLIGQVLNARERFGPMMWAPIANNVVSIAMFGVYLGVWGTNAAAGSAFTGGQVALLGACSTLGIVLQMAVLLPYMHRAGFRFHPRFDFRGTGLGQTFNVAKWMVGVAALVSLTQIVISQLASTAAARADGGTVGGLNAYNNAQLIWILPHSLLTISLATAILPAASRCANDDDPDGVAAEITRAIRLATTLIVPAAVAFLVLADPLVRLIFGHGSAASDYHVISWALAAMAIGLVPYTVQYLLLRAFYALSNTRTPFFLQIVISVANAGLASLFVLAWAQPSTVATWLAAAYSLAYVVGVIVTFRAIKRRLPSISGRELLAHLVRLTIATVPAVAVAWVIIWACSRWQGLWALAGSVVLAALVAVVVYFFVATRMRIPEIRQLTSMLGGIRRRLRRTPQEKDEDSEEKDVSEKDAPPLADVPLMDDFLMDDAPTTIFPGPLPQDDSQISGKSPISEPVPLPEPDTGLSASAGTIPEPGIDPSTATSILYNLDPDGRGIFVPIQPPTATPWPDPVRAGDMVGDRFRLERLLTDRPATQTWQASDVVLRRPVLIHLLAPGNPHAPGIVALARRAAAATDGRVLRVLDVADPTPGHGAYLVYEYAPGQTLASILEDGPLTGDEAAWVVREVADTLAGLHADGLYHNRLSPATVLITSTGNIKITGLLVDAAFDPNGGAGGPERDVCALGALLYACLVARWPYGDAYGLPAAPRDHGRLVPAHVFRPSVPVAVDAVVDRILSETPRNHASRLTTAAEVTTALSLVLGPASAAQDLRTRLDLPLEQGPQSHVAPPAPALPAMDFRVTTQIVEETAPLDGASIDDEEDDSFVAQALGQATVFTPVPPPAAPKKTPHEGDDAHPAKRSRRAPIIVIAAVVVVAGLVAAAILWPGSPFAPPTPAPTVSAAPTPGIVLAVSKATDFDPVKDGGGGDENPATTKLAIDGDPATAWTTERYRNRPDLGGLKPGTGLVLDLGQTGLVSSVDLKFVGTGTAVELRVPTQNAADPPMDTINKWTIVAAATNTGQSVTLIPPTPITTRYLLVYLTSLPKEGNYYRGEIAEVTVRG